ncbi:MAG: radical SAM protein [Phycisphaerales bacterium]|nr:radical SAM protein [Phycisphaerales bacterium]
MRDDSCRGMGRWPQPTDRMRIQPGRLPVGCRFCASGLDGLDGNLTAGQIIEQVWRLGALAGVERISNVVFMGMGEPLANFPAVTRAINTLMADWGLGISGRRITLSTVGLPAQIRRLAELDLPITLAISLHAPMMNCVAPSFLGRSLYLLMKYSTRECITSITPEEN